ncbi:hypothetical protein [Thermoflexus sp.]|uniref:hypothetical protein n=1 Tax=Thermoflexus sp. TaxID=1969742 RepID=UPI00184EE73C|nr:hypothetical protein [Thermoflexus sp.]
MLRGDVGRTQAIQRQVNGSIVRVEMLPVLGDPVTCLYCVSEERLNGMLRNQRGALTRKAHGLAKQAATWDAWVTVCWFEHNGIRPPPGLTGV